MLQETISGFDCDVVLKDGSTLALRSATLDDAGAVLAFLNSLSDRSHYQRFAGATKLTIDDARRLAAPGPGEGFSLIGECSGRVVAHAGFYHGVNSAGAAEVAFAISDGLHGKGIATRLLERLAERCEQGGEIVVNLPSLGRIEIRHPPHHLAQVPAVPACRASAGDRAAGKTRDRGKEKGRREKE